MSYADRVIRTQEAIGNLRTQGEQQSDEIQSDFLQRTGEILSDFHAKGQSLVDGSAAGLGGIPVSPFFFTIPPFLPPSPKYQ